MRRFKRSIAALSLVMALVTFWIAQMVLPADKLIEVSYALVLGIAFAVLLRWSKEAFLSLREGREGYHFLVFGVFSIVALIFFQRLWVIALRVYNRPDWLVDTPMSAFIPWMMAWSCTMVLIAPDTFDGEITSRSRVLIGLGLFVAGLVSGISIALSLTA